MNSEDGKVVCDEKCPTHGSLTMRGMLREGIVKSAKTKKTAVVVVDYVASVSKFSRFRKNRSNIHVHVPSCVSVVEGQKVRIAECRKLSKTKAHVLVPEGMVL